MIKEIETKLIAVEILLKIEQEKSQFDYTTHPNVRVLEIGKVVKVIENIWLQTNKGNTYGI